MDYAVTLDTTDAVRAGMEEIVVTLAIAFVLVILVVYLFLQDWRATLIPIPSQPPPLYRSLRDVYRRHMPMYVPKAGTDRTTETPACGAK